MLPRMPVSVFFLMLHDFYCSRREKKGMKLKRREVSWEERIEEEEKMGREGKQK